MSFTHLHNHTQFSFLDGVPTVEDLADHVLKLGQTAVAMTDHGEVSGHLKFQKACNDRGVKPIFGLEGYFVDNRREKDGSRKYEYDHMTLLATNDIGLHNLWTLSSLAYIEGMYYKPRIDWELLERYNEGIIATSGCLNGCVAAYLNEGGDKYNPDVAQERISRFAEIFDDRFYFEIHTFPDEKQEKLNQTLWTTSRNFGAFKCIAVSDSHYLLPGDWQKHELLIAAQMGKKWNDPTRYTYGEGALHVMSEESVRERLGTHLPVDAVEECIGNTQVISDMCDVTIKGQRTFPVFFNKPIEDEEHLREEAWKQFEWRIEKLKVGSTLPEYKERLEEELDLVISKGYAGYFLIVADMITWAKENGILIGPGRGSAGGSLLSYVLGITEIDPVAAGLMFGRFLDPGRKSLPDIDIDVPKVERPLVRGYLEGKYHVATIGTLNTLAPRMLLKDFARVLNIPNADVQEMIKVIENTKDLTVLDKDWQKVYSENRALFEDDLYEGSKLVRVAWRKQYPALFELMDEFSSHYRHAGAHAAGLVVSREPLLGKLPLRFKDGDVRTQMPMEDVEALGYVKMDLLGLRTLSTLIRTIDMTQKNWEERVTKDVLKPLHPYEWQYHEGYYDDEEVYRSLWDGRNIGIFQIETPGLSELTKRYKPLNMEDMCGVVSLFRPGITRAIDPETGLNLMEVFLRKREGRLPVRYKYPLLEPILSKTYGMFLYQEQVMKTCEVLAGYSAEEQDRIRKIMGKTKPEEMKRQRSIFVERCVERDVPENIAESIWNDMEQFGVYGFNRSHGYAYGMIAYWCAWFKHHYPAEFLTALFQTNEGDAKDYNRECRRLEIPLLGPDVNESQADFALVNGRIRYGLHAVKYVAGSSEVLQEKRPFRSMRDFMSKMDEGTRKVNKRVLESLIAVGAADSLVVEGDREGLPKDWSVTRVALWHLFRNRLKLGVKEKSLTDQEIFDKYLPQFEEYAVTLPVDNRADAELEYLGENVTTTPFGEWLDLIIKTSQYIGVEKMVTGETALVGGKIKKIRPLQVKKEGPSKGKKMCQMWIEYPVIEDGRVIDINEDQIVVFPEAFSKFRTKIIEDAPVVARVEKLRDNGGLMLLKLYRMDLDL